MKYELALSEIITFISDKTNVNMLCMNHGLFCSGNGITFILPLYIYIYIQLLLGVATSGGTSSFCPLTMDKITENVSHFIHQELFHDG